MPDFDTPVAKEHLKGIKGLPVVWIFDRGGVLAASLVGTNGAEVVDLVKEILQDGD